MTVYARQGTAPIQDGDTLDASEVEAEFEAIRVVLTGGIDSDNISPTAGILGSQLANSTVTESKITGSTITTASLATSATIKAYVDSQDGGNVVVDTALAAYPTWVDIPILTGTTLTPGATGDMILMDCTITINNTNRWYDLGFSVGGTDTGTIATVSYPIGNVPSYSAYAGVVTHHYSWMEAAASTTPVAVAPRIRSSAGDVGVGSPTYPTGYLAVFRAFIMPIK